MDDLTPIVFDRKDYYGIGNFKVKMFLGVFKIVLHGWAQIGNGLSLP